MSVAAVLRAVRVAGRNPWAYSASIAIALAGISLKAFQWYHSRPLWLDEEMIFLNIRDRTLSQLAGPLWLDQTAPLGWLALQRTVITLFGTDDRAVRAVSVLFGIATLICAVWVARRWMRPLGATLFVLLCSFGQWMMFYALEAKPYAADAFWALLLPSLAVWAIDGAGHTTQFSVRRSFVWWIAATVGQWFSYTATFVAPGCAAVLVTFAMRRIGMRGAVLVASQAIPWLVSFALHYHLVLRHARASTFLASYWSSGMAPEAMGFAGQLLWVAQRAEPLASHPGGTARWVIFWLLVGYGLAVRHRYRPAFAWASGLVVLSAGVLALLAVVPLDDRLALWIVPALYAAVCFAADDAVDRGRVWLVDRKPAALALAATVGVLLSLLLADMVQRSRDNVSLRAVNNHGLNDRLALSFLMVQRQPGDVLIATYQGVPAIWWYGDVSIADPNAGKTYERDGSPIFELIHEGPDSPICRKNRAGPQLQRVLAGARRAAIHLGFHSNSPLGLQEMILDTFNEFSRLVAFKRIANEGAVAIFEIGSPPEPAAIAAAQGLWRTADAASKLPGCISVRRAERK